MLFATESRRIKQSLTVAVSAAILSAAAPAVGQAAVTHHHRFQPGAGHTSPYTRAVSAASEWNTLK